MFHLKKFVYLFVLIGYSLSHAGSYDDFFSAVVRDDSKLVKQLLMRGFDPNSVSPAGEQALLIAVRQESLDVARLLITNPGTRVEVRSVKDESPLMLASIKGHLEICRLLIARDADVNKPGWTPLHYAASGGNAEVVQLLLDNYAYVDAESPNGSTPLMMAAMYGSPETVRTLLAAGADPTLKNARGLTALDFARRANKQDAALLIAAALRGKQPEASW
jgi:ankyrin repeat protein